MKRCRYTQVTSLVALLLECHLCPLHAFSQEPVTAGEAGIAHSRVRTRVRSFFRYSFTPGHSKDTIAKYSPANKTTKMTAMPAKRTKRALTVGRPPSVVSICSSKGSNIMPPSPVADYADYAAFAAPCMRLNSISSSFSSLRSPCLNSRRSVCAFSFSSSR